MRFLGPGTWIPVRNGYFSGGVGVASDHAVDTGADKAAETTYRLFVRLIGRYPTHQVCGNPGYSFLSGQSEDKYADHVCIAPDR